MTLGNIPLQLLNPFIRLVIYHQTSQMHPIHHTLLHLHGMRHDMQNDINHYFASVSLLKKMIPSPGHQHHLMVWYPFYFPFFESLLFMCLLYWNGHNNNLFLFQMNCQIWTVMLTSQLFHLLRKRNTVAVLIQLFLRVKM